MQRLLELKRKAVKEAAAELPAAPEVEAANEVGPSAADVVAAEVLEAGGSAGMLEGLSIPKKKRVIDTLKSLMPGEGDEGSEGDESDLDDGLLNWRAKGV